MTDSPTPADQPTDPHRVDEVVGHFSPDSPSDAELWTRRLPFASVTESVHTRPDWVYEGPSQDEAISRLLYVAEQMRPAAVVSGPTGTGKTVVLATAAAELRRLGHPVLTLDLTAATADDVIDQTARQAGLAMRDIDPTLVRLRAVRRWVDGQLAADRLVIVADHLADAQPDGAMVLDRLLAGCDSERASVTLLTTEATPSPLRWLSRHSGLRVETTALTGDETDDFLAGGIAAAVPSAFTPRFTTEAAARLHELTGGVPRLIARAAGPIYLAGASERMTELSVDLVHAMQPELIAA